MWMVGEVFEQDAAQTAFFIGGHTGWDSVDTNSVLFLTFTMEHFALVFTGKLPVRLFGIS